MNAEERLVNAGFDDVIYFINPSYDDVLIGVAVKENVAIYDYDKMIQWLVDTEGMEWDEAIEFIDFNTLGAYFGDGTPIIMYSV